MKILLLGILSFQIASSCYDSAFELVRNRGNGFLDVIEGGLKCIKGVDREQRKLIVIGIIGPHRSGKSYTLNNIIDPSGSSNVFSIGHTQHSHSKGVWGYLLKDSEASSNKTFLFLDTEGLYSTEGSEQADSRIVSLLSLLSGTLIYNQKEVLHAKEIEQFKYIVKYAAPLRNEPKKKIRPDLIWILHSFHLSLKDESLENEISATQYIKGSLERQKFTDWKTYFNSLEGFAIVQPTLKAEDLKRLPENPRLRVPEFKLQMKILRQKLFSLTRGPKVIASRGWAGGDLSDTLEIATRRLNRDTDFDISHFDVLLQNLFQKKIKELVEDYHTQIKKSVRLPASQTDLFQANKDAQKSVKMSFSKYLSQKELKADERAENEEILKLEFTAKLEDAYRKYKSDNVLKIQQRIETLAKVELSTYKNKWSKKGQSAVKFPMMERELMALHRKFQELVTSTYVDSLSNLLTNDNLEKRKQELTGRIGKILEEKKDHNRKMSEAVCGEVARANKKQLKTRVQSAGDMSEWPTIEKEIYDDFSRYCKGPAKAQYHSRLGLFEQKSVMQSLIDEARHDWIQKFGSLFVLNSMILVVCLLTGNFFISLMVFGLSIMFWGWAYFTIPVIPYFSPWDYVNSPWESIGYLLHTIGSMMIFLFDFVANFGLDHPWISLTITFLILGITQLMMSRR